MQKLAEAATAYDIRLSERQLSHFARYERLLQNWNRRINLTAIVEPADIRARHFLDALSCTTVTGNLDGRRLIDVGTGAGFPGLRLKILYPGMKLTLVESVTKKTRFLETVVNELGLREVTICDKRAESLGHEPAHRAQYDWAVARGVAKLPVLLEYLLPFCRLGGHALAQKGESALAETEDAEHALQILGGAPPDIFPIRLSQVEKVHYLVVIKKIQATPEIYPRRPGRPAKRPL